MPHNPSADRARDVALPARSAPGRASVPFVLFLLGFLVLYLLAVCTPIGQRIENAVLSSENGSKPAWIHEFSGAYSATGPTLPPLGELALPTAAVGLLVLVLLTLVRRCWWQGAAAVCVAGAAIGAAEVLGQVLPRPDLVNAPVYFVEPSFPSGHAAVASALVVAALFAVPERLRPWLLVVGAAWLAMVAGAVQATLHHRPSDVVGSTLLVCIAYRLALWLRPTVAPTFAARPATVAAASACAVVGAVIGGSRSDSLGQSAVFAAVAVGCAALAWLAVKDQVVTRAQSD